MKYTKGLALQLEGVWKTRKQALPQSQCVTRQFENNPMLAPQTCFI
jgi:hypothetical protein